jgi:hypothetical protein
MGMAGLCLAECSDVNSFCCTGLLWFQCVDNEVRGIDAFDVGVGPSVFEETKDRLTGFRDAPRLLNAEISPAKVPLGAGIAGAAVTLGCVAGAADTAERR